MMMMMNGKLRDVVQFDDRGTLDKSIMRTLTRMVRTRESITRSCESMTCRVQRCQTTRACLGGGILGSVSCELRGLPSTTLALSSNKEPALTLDIYDHR